MLGSEWMRSIKTGRQPFSKLNSSTPYLPPSTKSRWCGRYNPPTDPSRSCSTSCSCPRLVPQRHLRHLILNQIALFTSREHELRLRIVEVVISRIPLLLWDGSECVLASGI